MKMNVVVCALLVASSCAAAVPRDFSDVADIKREVMRVYGVRSARAIDARTVRIVIGASVTGARSTPASYRIISESDGNYAYEKFVRPVKVLSAKPSRKEFDFLVAKQKGVAQSLTRSEVVMELPFPLKKGARYHIIAQGDGGSMVTAGLCSASFVFGAPADPLEDGDAIAAQMTGLRRISSVGDGKILCEFGHGYSPDGGLKLGEWKVTVNGKERKVLAIGRRSRIECYQPVGWPFTGFLEHCVFLDLGRELEKGDKVAVEVSPAVCSGERRSSFAFDPAKSISGSIKVNQVGYLVDALKVAYVGRWFGSMPDPGAVPAEMKGDASSSFSAKSYYAEAGNGTQEEREQAELAAKAAAEEAAATIAADAEKSPRGEYASLAPYALRLRGKTAFSLIDVKTGAKAYEGTLEFVHNGFDNDGKSNHSAENVYTADFTGLRKAGTYVLSVDDIGCSLPFEISDDVYRKAFFAQARGVYLQRCGCELDPELSGGWRRIACHTNGVVATTVQRHASAEWGAFTDNMVMDPNPHTLAIVGGHHDAGDYNPRSHIDVAQALLNAYELAPGNFTDSQLSVPERGNGIPDIVDEALWAAKIWEGLQDDDGGVRNGTESQGDPNFVQTVELDDKGDYAWAKDSKGSYLAAGVFAQLSRVLDKCGKKDRASEFLVRARRAYAWAVANPAPVKKDLFKWGEYNVSLRAYAAAQLYHTTWEKKFHDDFLSLTPWREKPNSEMVSYGNFDLQLAAYAYVLIPRDKADGAVWDAVLGAIRKEADMYVRGSERMAYKFLRHPYAPITWGTGAYQNYAIPAAFLWKLTGEQKWHDWLVRTCDNTLGANPMGISWITGLGSRTVRCPLHNSRYRPGGLPADGIQEQGPNKNFAGYSYRDTAYPRCVDRFALLYQHSDVHFAIAMDEPTVNNMANTMLVFGILSER